MKFLVDQPVSWEVARELRDAGHDALHVRDLRMSAASDELILERARGEERVVITQDTDYGTLLATSGSRSPSVVLLRLRDGQPRVHSRLLLEYLPTVESHLRQGAIVVIGERSIRIRRLPVK